MTEIVYPDGSTCDPWLSDCKVPEDDENILLQMRDAGLTAAIVYGVISSLAALVPPSIWFADRRNKVSPLSQNEFYEWAWIVMWIGHISIYGFPGLLWPISFAAYPLFNSFYVMWQQYGTFLLGTIFNFAVIGLYVTSYIMFKEETGIEKDTILIETIVYSGVMLPCFVVMWVLNRDFQYFYQVNYKFKAQAVISL